MAEASSSHKNKKVPNEVEKKNEQQAKFCPSNYSYQYGGKRGEFDGCIYYKWVVLVPHHIGVKQQELWEGHG